MTAASSVDSMVEHLVVWTAEYWVAPSAESSVEHLAALMVERLVAHSDEHWADLTAAH